MRSRTRACKGGRPNDSGCPGSETESESCDTGVECEPVFESGGMFNQLIQNYVEIDSMRPYPILYFQKL